MIKIDRYLHSIVEIIPTNHKNKKRPERKRSYFIKTPRSKKVIKQLTNYLYESKKQNEYLYFITITTKQHESKFTDKQLFSQIGLWLKNRGCQYICVCERQKFTGDLHFHIVIRQKQNFYIQKEILYLSRLFNIKPHPALFDVKKIYKISQILGYITKYITKKGDYSSMFNCRTFSISKGLRKEYKENAYKSTFIISREFKLSNKQLFVEKYKTDYFIVYQFSYDIWKLASRYKTEHRNKDSVKI